MQFRLGTLLIFVAIAAVLSYGAYTLYETRETIHNAYAVWWVGDMVVEHMAANDGQWPDSWEELRDDYQTCVNRSGQPWQFAELRDRVTIDWDVVPGDLVEQQTNAIPDFRVIWLRDGIRFQLGARC